MAKSSGHSDEKSCSRFSEYVIFRIKKELHIYLRSYKEIEIKVCGLLNYQIWLNTCCVPGTGLRAFYMNYLIWLLQQPYETGTLQPSEGSLHSR